MILDLQNIFKDYQQEKLVVPVLKDVSLQVEEGEYVAIMGPSGSGKTTLMNIIGCLDRPTSGAYQLAGEDVLKCKDKEMSDLRLRSIGFVFQSFQLLSRQTALDNVALPLSYAGVKKKERRQRATQALERVGLGDRVSFKPTQLSGGQKQRVAIARAMVNNPKILLADEPTGALDSKSGEQIMELFEQLNEEGVTIVMITHDRNIASKAKRIVHIIDGIITEEGEGSEPIISTIHDGEAEVSTMHGDGGTEFAIYSGEAVDNAVYGDSGADSADSALYGAGGADGIDSAVHGDDSADGAMHGGDGADSDDSTMHGGHGADGTMHGGNGADSVDSAMHGSGGADSVDSSVHGAGNADGGAEGSSRQESQGHRGKKRGKHKKWGAAFGKRNGKEDQNG